MGFLLTALVVGALAWWLGRRAGDRGLAEIERVVRAAKTGDLSARADESGDGPAGRVARELDGLLDGLAARRSRILSVDAATAVDMLDVIFENAPLLIFAKDADGRFLAVNRQLTDLFHRTAEEMLGRTDHDLLPADIADRIVRDDRAVLRDGKPAEFEDVIPVDGGERSYVSIKCPLRDRNGRIVGICGLAAEVTDLRRAQAELVAAREAAARAEGDRRFRELFEAAPVPLLFIERGTDDIGGVNRRFVDLLGYTRDDLRNGRDWWPRAYPDPDYRAHVERTWKAAVAQADPTGLVTPVESCVTCRDGRVLTVLIGGQRMAGGMIVSVLDVTGRRALEAAAEQSRARLAQSEARFRSIFEEAPLGIALVDSRTGRMQEVNRRFADIVGRSREALATIDWMRITHPDDVRADLDHLARMNAGETTGFVMRKRYLRPDGAIVWVGLTVASVAVEAGEAPRHLALVADISDRVRAETEIRRAGERLRLAVESADIGVWAWNFADESLEWDDRMCAWYAVPDDVRRAGISYAFWRSRVHPDDVLRVETALLALRRDGTSCSEEFRVVLPDGRVRHLHSASMIDHDASGHPERMIGVNRDVTEQREHEARLRAAKEAAEVAERAKSAFLANMSHELRTPMNGVIGMTHLALKPDLAAEKREGYLRKALAAGQHLLDILDDIIEFARIDAGRMPVERRAFDPVALLDDVVAGLADAANRKGLVLTADVAPDLPRRAVGDVVGLRQILRNLLANAVKFTEQGSVELAAGIRDRTDREFVLEVAVRDTGIGLTDEQKGRLFRSFEQADNSMTRTYGGTGLGLAMAKQLVELMGGEIGVDSEPGRGSTFRVAVRLGIGDAAAGSAGGVSDAGRREGGERDASGDPRG